MEVSGYAGSVVQRTVNITNLANVEESAPDRTYNGHFILFSLFVVLIVIIIFAYVYSRCIYINDYFRVGSLGAALHRDEPNCIGEDRRGGQPTSW